MFSKKFNKRNLFILFLSVVTGALGLMLTFILKPISEQSLHTTEKVRSIGIVMPMDHAALRSMIAGFKIAIQEHYPYPVEIKVKNAQHDMNVQASIFQQLMRSKVDLIVPIGTTATQMAISMLQNQKMVSLAAHVPPALQIKAQNKSLALMGVLDEIGPEKPLQFLKALNPNLKKISLIYSNSEKVFPEVEAAIAEGEKSNIQVQKLMIQALPELYTISRLIASDSEAIFILKDHLVVSGIQTLLQEAQKRNIPILASDEGSVLEGAHFALGVKEAEIGKLGGQLAAQLLQTEGDHSTEIQKGSIEIKTLDRLSIFYNPDSCLKQNVDIKNLRSLAGQFKYDVEVLENK